MDLLKQLELLFDPILKAYDVKLYDLKWTGPSNNRTLEVSILKNDGTMDLDTCALVSEKISEVLDEKDLINSAYTLEVCSPGAEREIFDFEELKGIEKPYIAVRLKKPINKKVEYIGEVQSYQDHMITLQYQDKAKKKEVVIHDKDIEKMRFAVRI
ncbi:MAG: ribosome maturation factor RimP [Solobacterium sp.]|nr:ribosome maturation factor RimP [Solobacterium sp.]